MSEGAEKAINKMKFEIQTFSQREDRNLSNPVENFSMDNSIMNWDTKKNKPITDVDMALMQPIKPVQIVNE